MTGLFIHGIYDAREVRKGWIFQATYQSSLFPANILKLFFKNYICNLYGYFVKLHFLENYVNYLDVWRLYFLFFAAMLHKSQKTKKTARTLCETKHNACDETENYINTKFFLFLNVFRIYFFLF